MVTGGTASAFFPLTRPFQERGAGSSDAFVARLSGDGAELLYSSLLGGRGEPPPELPGEYGAAVAADGEGKAYLVGSATSADFPLTSPLADGIYAGFSEAFIAAITPRGQSRDRISSWSLVCRPEAVEIFGAGMYQRDRQQLAVEGGDWVTLQLGGKLASPERELPESVAFTFGDGRVVTRERPHRLLAEGYAFEWSGAPGEVGAAVAERPGQTTARALVAYAPRPQAQGLWTSVGRTTMLNVYRDRFAPAGLSLRLPEPLARATDVSVAVAFFDNDPDERPLVVRAEAGGVAAEAAQARSTHGEMLNIERLTLRAVPAGTQELRVTLASPVQGGDSGLLLGASASYPCEGPPPGDGQAPVVEAFTINDGAPIVEGPEVRLSVRASAPTPGGSVVALRIAELVCRPGGGGGGCVWSAEQERTVAYPATPAAIAWALAPLPGARTFLIWAGDDTGAWSREPASAAVEVVLPRDQGAGRDGAERRLVFLPVVQRSGVR